MSFIEEYQINLIFRMVISCICGILLGFERKNRAKVAEIRTHCIVACASAMRADTQLLKIWQFLKKVSIDFEIQIVIA